MKTKSLPVYLAIGLAILAVSTASIFIRFAQKEAPSLVIAAYRMVISVVILAPIAIIKRGKEFKTISAKHWLLIGLGGLFLALHFATWITSLEKTSVASSVVIVTTAPLWVAMFSPVFLKEKISKYILIGLGIAVIGGIIVGLNEFCSITLWKVSCQAAGSSISKTMIVGDLLALAGAIFSGAYLMVGRAVRRSVSLEAYLFLVYGVAAVILVVMVMAFRLPFTGFGSNTYMYLLWLALIPQLIGHSTFNWALKHISAVFVSIALLGEPIGSAILAMIFLKETPTIFEIAGGVLILLGIFLAGQAEGKRAKTVTEISVSLD